MFELRRRGNAVSTGNQATDPYLFYRDQAGRQQMTVLGSTTDRLTIGRAEGCDLHLGWDHEVSRLHAQLEHIGTDWVLGDDGCPVTAPTSTVNG